MVCDESSCVAELATAPTDRRRRASPVAGPAVRTGRHGAGASGSAVAALAPAQTVATLQELVTAGQACGVCQAELADSDVRLECTSQSNCQREYHPLCVGDWFGHLYRAKDLSIPQPKDSKWRCMLCSDVCASARPQLGLG